MFVSEYQIFINLIIILYTNYFIQIKRQIYNFVSKNDFFYQKIYLYKKKFKSRINKRNIIWIEKGSYLLICLTYRAWQDLNLRHPSPKPGTLSGRILLSRLDYRPIFYIFVVYKLWNFQ